MELKAEQLLTSLKKELKPVYLVASDEHLLLEEACDAIIKAAFEAGHTEKERLLVEKGFNWQSLNDASCNMSLFGDKKLIDLRITNGKPGAEGSDAIVRYLDNASTDNILLIRCPQLNKQSQNSKWVKNLKATGVFCLIWKVKAEQLPAWISQRAKSRALILDREAANILAERVEGNLLAAHQEIEKLSLLFPENSQINAKQVIQTVASSSRYDVFSMMEQALLGNARKSLQMYRGLREERTDLTIIAWAIRNEIDSLYAIFERSQTQNRSQVFKEMRIWQSKQNPYNKALNRYQQRDFRTFIQALATLDQAIKGQLKDSADNICEALLLNIAGIKTPV